MPSREATVLACVAVFVLLSAASHCSEAKLLGYKTIKQGNRGRRCGTGKARYCVPRSSNKYDRSCSKENGCRTPGPPRKPRDDDEKIIPGHDSPNPNPSLDPKQPKRRDGVENHRKMKSSVRRHLSKDAKPVGSV